MNIWTPKRKKHFFSRMLACYYWLEFSFGIWRLAKHKLPSQSDIWCVVYTTPFHVYDSNSVIRFEKLDITPRSAQKIKPVLERWMAEAEARHKNGFNQLSDFIGTEPSKKRKRRTSFTPQALEYLNRMFEKNTHPTGSEMTSMSQELNYDREVIRVWFCNKRQALKNTIKKLKAAEAEAQANSVEHKQVIKVWSLGIKKKKCAFLSLDSYWNYHLWPIDHHRNMFLI